MTGPDTGSEWRRYPMLPIAAGLGYATSVIHIYGLGPYIEPISAEFGWSRTQVTLGLTFQTLIAGVCAVPIGMIVDRTSPRLLGLVGVLLVAAAFALLSTATGEPANWYVLWIILAVAALPVQATVWTAAVATRFHNSRGMALAVTLCGASVAQAIFPYLGSYLINEHGWKAALVLQAAIWAAVAFPFLFFFFHTARDRTGRDANTAADPDVALQGVSARDAVCTSVYARLFLVSLLFTFTIIALVVHFVPILSARGIDRLEAAGLAGLIGLFSIGGRLTTGVLIDRYRASFVGAAVFLLPVIGCFTLMTSGASPVGAAVSAALIGLTLGAEVDVLAYLTTRHFGMKYFGTLFGGLLVALSIGTATGPLAAAVIYDDYGSYLPLLWLTVAFMLLSSIALASLPRPAATAPIK